MKKVFIVCLVGLLAGSCSVLKQSECRQKYVTVTVISRYGTQRVQVPYCDTIYLGEKKPPQGIDIVFKKQ